MTQARVLLLGENSSVGLSLQHIWKTSPTVPNWNLSSHDSQTLDILNPSALRDAIQEFQPDLVINTYELTDLDITEQDELAATKANFHVVANLAAQCSAIDARLIHLSTSYVFDGRKSSPYETDDLMNPINNYGASKMMGEEALRHELPWHVIIRTSGLIGPFGKNILTETITAARKGDSIRTMGDLTLSPTPSLDVARAILVIGAALLGGKVDGFGTFHYAGTPTSTHAELIGAILERYAELYGQHPGTEQAKTSGPYPTYTALKSSKVERIYGLPAPDWRAGLREAITLSTPHP